MVLVSYEKSLIALLCVLIAESVSVTTESHRQQLTTQFRISAFLLLVGLFLNASARSEEVTESTPHSKWELLARDHAYVTPLSVSSPLNSLLLVRYAGTLCAIRFRAFHGGDEKAPTAFNSGDETLFATAEQIRLVQSETTWRIFERKRLDLVSGPVVGLGRFGFQKGRIGLHCGNAKLEWTYPNNVSLGSYTQPTAKRVLVEIAPTAWSEVSQINLNDKKLHWYRYDEGRKDTLVSIEELPRSVP
jgi:hypothetical protein